ncbi:MAG: putative Ig domain-containing protein [Actinobacteria bacterium]|nr:putative Ig domain-containing protein [Actinomycetota bacterium]
MTIRRATSALLSAALAASALATVGFVTSPATATTACRAGATAITSGSTLVCQERIDASGTWTPPAGVSLVDVAVVGAGGGGGGGAYRYSPFQSAGGSGGGAGSVTVKRNISVSSSVPITIGAGGTAGLRGFPAAGSGGAGESSHFGTVTALGGVGGQGAIGDGTVTRGGGSGRTLNGTTVTSTGGTSLSRSNETVGGGGAGAGSPQAGPSTNAALYLSELRNGDGGNGVNLVSTGGLFAIGPDQWFAGGGAGGLSAVGQYSANPGYYGGGPGVWAGMNPTGIANTGGGGGGGGYRYSLGNADAGGAGGSGVVVVRWTPPPVVEAPDGAGLINGRFDQTLRVAQQTGAAPFTWSLESGSLPAGLALSAGGVISGVPTGPVGTSYYSVKVVDSRGAEAIGSASIIVSAPLVITTTSVANAFRTVPYTATIVASGGATPYLSFYVSSGRLAPGLTINDAGVISGTPTSTGTFTFSIGVSDSKYDYAAAPFTIVVTTPPALSITTAALTAGASGVAYSFALQATGGVGTHAWSLASGTLPPGLTLNSEGLISGTPTTSGTYTFTPRVTAGTTVTRSLTLTVQPQLIITTDTLPTGATSTAYSTTLAATGGTSYSWAVTSGSLPAGLTVTTGGVLSGTPTVAGTSTFTLSVTDNFGRTESKPMQLLVTASPPLAIVTTTLSDGTIGLGYAQLLEATGGVGARTWSVSSGPLPAGLILDSDGTLHGTPTSAGSTDFTVRVDTATESATQSLTLVVNPQLVITTDSLPDGATLAAYSTTLTATGGSPYTWVLTAGLLPAGLNLATDGTISGTPGGAGVASFTVTVTDNLGRTESKRFALGISQTPALTITTSALDEGEVDAAYTEMVQATGGVGARTWSLLSGSLPAGLSLHSDGTLTGVPTTAGTSTFTVKVVAGVSNTTKSLTLTVRPQLAITTVTVPSGATLVAYSTTLAATGGTSYTWAVTAGSLPVGLSLSSAGVLSGTPSAAGASTFTATVTDNLGRTQARPFALDIAQSPALAVVTTTLDDGEVGLAYTVELLATGGVGTHTWSQASALPPGMAVHSDGTLTGIPTAAGSYDFTVQVTTGTETVTQPLTLVVRAQLAITTDTLPAGDTLVPYSQSLAASGGSPYSWAMTSGALPAGLTLDSDGTLHGTPTTAGTANFTLTVTDTFDRTESKAFTMVVAQTPPLTVITTSLPSGTIAQGYAGTLEATGGIGARTWSIVSGSLPAGLSLDASGAITGIPTALGTSTFTVRVETSTETADAVVSLTIDQPVAITTSSLPGVKAGGSYSQQLAASGGDGSYTWSLAGGQLPAGLTLSTAGAISGTVATSTLAGTYQLTIDAVDGRGGFDTRTFTLVVSTPVRVVTTAMPPAGSVGLYSVTLAAAGGTGPYTWSQVGPVLPSGLTLKTTGTISGQLFATGTFAFRVRATDSHGNSATTLLSLTVSATAAQTQSCATFPSSLPVKGTRVVAQAGCRTSAKQVVRVSARCVWGIARAGDLRICAVQRDANGRLVVRTFGRHPVTVNVVIWAPAATGFGAYRVTHRYVIR